MRNKLFSSAVLLLFFMLALRSDYLILTDFSNAPIPYSDLNQYSNDWPSGGGVKEAVEFFKNEAKRGKIYVATQGTFGLMPYALEIYLVNNPNIKIEGYWPIGDEIPSRVLKESKKVPTYFVFYQPCQACDSIGFAPKEWENNLNLIYRYDKGYNRFLSLYRVKP